MRECKKYYPSDQALWLREKIPIPLKILLTLGIPLVFYGIFGGFYAGRLDVVLVILICGCGPLLFLYTNGTGLKVAWDEKRVYMRPSSFSRPTWRRPWLQRMPWRSLAYDEIESLDAITLNDPGGSLLLPFQLLRLTAPDSEDEFGERHLWLYSQTLRTDEIAPLLRQLKKKCNCDLPAIVSERLATYAVNDR